MNRLRSLAVTVDEPDPGCFCWSVMEAPPDSSSFVVLSTSPVSYSSYDAALSAGVEALRESCRDLGIGPRAEGHRDDEPNNSGWTPL